MTDAKNNTSAKAPVEPGEVMIHVDNLKKSFGDNHVLNGITQSSSRAQTSPTAKWTSMRFAEEWAWSSSTSISSPI